MDLQFKLQEAQIKKRTKEIDESISNLEANQDPKFNDLSWIISELENILESK